VSSNWILTHAGHSFSYDDEHIESNTYDVQDIAHSLALTCRYGGMTDYHERKWTQVSRKVRSDGKHETGRGFAE